MRKISDEAFVAEAVSTRVEMDEKTEIEPTADIQHSLVGSNVEASASTSQPPSDRNDPDTSSGESDPLPPSAGEAETKPPAAYAETNSTNSFGGTAPLQAPAKPDPPPKGLKNIPFITAAADKAAMISKTRVGKQQPEKRPDTFVSAPDTDNISQLITATLALIADGGPITKRCAQLKVKAGDQIAKLRQDHFDTWAAIGGNLSGLRTASKTKSALGFNTICTVQLGLQRTKGNRLADCHESLIALPEAYQDALRELRKTATTDAVEKVKQVMAEGVSEPEIKDRLAAKFSRKAQPKPSAQEFAKSKFLAALDSIKGLDARRSYCREVLEKATRLVGWTFTESNSVASIAQAVAPKTAEDTPDSNAEREESMKPNGASEMAITVH